MAIHDWRRIREQADRTPPLPHASNAWAPLPGEEEASPDEADATDGRSGEPEATDPGKIDEYFAWAERLKAKKARNQEAARAVEGVAEPSYWTTESVFAESRRVEHEEAASDLVSGATDEAFATLDLAPGATPDAITEAYRRLAKEHHPDRFSTADPATERHHEDLMAAVNDAYRLLRVARRM